MAEGKFSFTESQRKVISLSTQMIKNILKSNSGFVLKIIGSAGTGKTTIVSGILHALYKFPLSHISIVAPTHNAVSVIEQKITSYAKDNPDVPVNKYRFLTLASLLKMERVYNRETQKTDFTMGEKTDKYALVGEKLVIIDEASMVTKDQYLKLCELAERHKIVLIFLGDIKQLPPVKEKASPAVEEEFTPNTFSFTLTEIIRQGPGNPILHVAHNLSVVKDFTAHLIDGKGYLYTVDRNSVLKNLTRGGGTEKLKYLAWSNTDVDGINTDVRKILYGENPKGFYVGETVISQSNSVHAKNNQEIYIDQIRPKSMKFAICTKEEYFSLPFKLSSLVDSPESLSSENPRIYFNGHNLIAVLNVTLINNLHNVIEKDSTQVYKNTVSIYKYLVKERKIRWTALAYFEDLFFKYKHSYAMTVHKSQGNTFKNVIINLRDLERNKKEFDQILYTAITRASEKVIFFYPLKNENENE